MERKYDEAINIINKRNQFKYELLLKRYNLIAEECLFIDDDDSGRNYQTANKIGIKGRRVKPNSKEDIMNLINEFNVEL